MINCCNFYILYSCANIFSGNVQMENQNRELADENSCLHEEIERLQIMLDQYLSSSATSGRVRVFGMY